MVNVLFVSVNELYTKYSGSPLNLLLSNHHLPLFANAGINKLDPPTLKEILQFVNYSPKQNSMTSKTSLFHPVFVRRLATARSNYATQALPFACQVMDNYGNLFHCVPS